MNSNGAFVAHEHCARWPQHIVNVVPPHAGQSKCHSSLRQFMAAVSVCVGHSLGWAWVDGFRTFCCLSTKFQRASGSTRNKSNIILVFGIAMNVVWLLRPHESERHALTMVCVMRATRIIPLMRNMIKCQFAPQRKPLRCVFCVNSNDTRYESLLNACPQRSEIRFAESFGSPLNTCKNKNHRINFGIHLFFILETESLTICLSAPKNVAVDKAKLNNARNVIKKNETIDRIIDAALTCKISPDILSAKIKIMSAREGCEGKSNINHLVRSEPVITIQRDNSSKKRSYFIRLLFHCL